MVSERWQMPFNISKCKNLHIGRTNHNHIYSMAGCSIEQTVEERDLGIFDNQIKVSWSCVYSYSKKASGAN